MSTYCAEVHIESLGSGSALLWTGTFSTRVPGLGPILRLLIGRAIDMIATAVVIAAERECPEDPAIDVQADEGVQADDGGHPI